MTKETAGFIIGTLIGLLIKFVMGVVVPSLLISHGLNLIGVEVPSNTIGLFLLALWFIQIFLISFKAPLKENK